MIKLKRSQRKVGLVAFHQISTYAGHLEASPIPRVVERVIEGNKEQALRIFGKLPLHVAKPELISRPYRHPLLPDGMGVELPPVLNMLHLRSDALNRQRVNAYEYHSELLVLLYSHASVVEAATLETLLPSLPWKEAAREFDITDF